MDRKCHVVVACTRRAVRWQEKHVIRIPSKQTCAPMAIVWPMSKPEKNADESGNFRTHEKLSNLSFQHWKVCLLLDHCFASVCMYCQFVKPLHKLAELRYAMMAGPLRSSDPGDQRHAGWRDKIKVRSIEGRSDWLIARRATFPDA